MSDVTTLSPAWSETAQRVPAATIDHNGGSQPNSECGRFDAVDLPAAALQPKSVRAALSESPEAGSETTEYALVMIVAATIAALALAWARGGAISHLLDGVMAQVRSIFGI